MVSGNNNLIESIEIICFLCGDGGRFYSEQSIEKLPIELFKPVNEMIEAVKQNIEWWENRVHHKNNIKSK